MRRFLLAVMAAAVCLVGCGGATMTGGGPSDPPPVPENKLRVEDKVIHYGSDQSQTMTVPDSFWDFLLGFLGEPQATKDRYQSFMSYVTSGKPIEMQYGPASRGGGYTYRTIIQLKDGGSFSPSLPYSGKYLSMKVFNLDTGASSELGIKFVLNNHGLLFGVRMIYPDGSMAHISNEGAQDAYEDYMQDLLTHSFGLTEQQALWAAWGVEIALIVWLV